MKLLHVFFFCLFAFGTDFTEAQVSSFLKKAEKNIEIGNLKNAKENYAKAIELEPENRKANLGMGLLLSELLENYDAALPYLEKANSISVKDSSYDLIYALAKCYHYAGKFEKAISYYNRLDKIEDLEREGDFQVEIKKRKEDSEYAIAHQSDKLLENIYIVNCGRTINTDMPEYVPVLSGQNELIFTSKRKDEKKEELNYLDGKYFESMYIATIEANSFSNMRRYTLPDKLVNSKYYKHHQSVVSLSQDGKKLFTFKDSKLFEIDLEQRKMEAPEELKIGNANFYQNHAYLSGDAKTLYFTSDALGGLGANDIYKSFKTQTGEWSIPENLGPEINTPFNEDAPFLSSDGTLYFASEGHPGFGNYDIYKSNLADNKWSHPINLGQPINSPGHDIFLISDSLNSVGYFSSGRNGGFGDMDIYKIIYLDKIPKNCPTLPSSQIVYQIIDEDTSDYKNKIELIFPDNYKIMSVEWQLEGSSTISNEKIFENDYKNVGVFSVKSKIVAWCDTCLSPIISCSMIDNRIEKMIPIAIVQTETTATVTPKIEDDSKTNNKSIVHSPSLKLNAEQLKSIGFNESHILFDFNKSTLRPESKTILDENILVLKNNPQLVLEINGFADTRGTESANKKISSQRATEVRKYLVSAGLQKNQIKETVGFGSSRPYIDCETKVCSEEEYQQNRRVEFVVMSNNK